jgi:hypothetical protein
MVLSNNNIAKNVCCAFTDKLANNAMTSSELLHFGAAVDNLLGAVAVRVFVCSLVSIKYKSMVDQRTSCGRIGTTCTPCATGGP